MASNEPEPDILTITDLTHSYRTGVPVLSGVNLTVPRGEIVALVGRSGAGKSTLLRCINGLITPTGGDLRVFGQPTARLPESRRRRVRRRIGMIFQEFNLVDRLTAMKNVLVGRLGYTSTVRSCLHLFGPKQLALASECLAQVGLAGYEWVRVRELSGGQKQRVAIARTMAQQSELILGDEATANLDVHTTDDIMIMLQRLARERNVTLLLSMHNLDVARAYCDRIVGLKDGRIAFSVPAAQMDDDAVRGLLG